ncbi:hypothetical protein NKH77_12365 [Streptomyces sp. M19]
MQREAELEIEPEQIVLGGRGRGLGDGGLGDGGLGASGSGPVW